MELIVAKTAGFCFGVERAVDMVYNRQDETPMVTYGPIIHNPQLVSDLEQKGIHVVDNVEDLKNIAPCKVVIRSHGIGEDLMDAIKDAGHEVVDATCPFVTKIHKIVKRHEAQGREVIIIGNANHPEIIGIRGWTKLPTHVIDALEDVDSLDRHKTYGVVAQTTFNINLYKEIIDKLQRLDFHVMIDETICSATHERQEEAYIIAQKVNKMIVIGGKHSSNTKKLYEICKGQCDETYHIETIDDLELNVFGSNDIIGITAGASTPKNIIEEVILNVGRKNL